MRLIGADDLIRFIIDVWDWDRLDELQASTVLRQTLSDIDNQPTVDAVEVIRCKDCEFWQVDWIPNTGGDRGCHYCEMMDSFTEPLNYCGYGDHKILPKD